MEQEQPIEDVLFKLMNDIGKIISGALNETVKETGEKYGFALLMFGMKGDEKSRMNYLSNCNRDDMLVALKEFIARAEGRYYSRDEKMFDFNKKKQ